MNARALRFFKRCTIALLLAAQVYAVIPHDEVRHQYAFASSVTCPTVPGNYVPGGTLSATTNSYWQPPAGTLAAGSTTISLGTQDTGGGGAVTGVSQGDELLIIQMQDGTFNTSNSSNYGDGSGTGHGYTSLGNAGLYEYVSVTSAVSNVTTGTVTVQGIGAGSGLLNSYYEATATNQRYQIVRVPQYTTATLSGNFKAAYWDGKTGGVAVIDMASTLNLAGASVYATGDGFRGGAVSVSGTSPAGVLNNDYVDSAAMNAGQPAFGTKGEGVNGSPRAVFYYNTFTTPSTPSGPTLSNTPGTANGYTSGDQGMGAPGNGGGGGTDDDPAANDQNTGGGGGGNGGAGGNGGYPWTPNYSGNTSLYSNVGVHTATGYSSFNSGDFGGRGGASVSASASVSRVFMGGGGGAGSNNNASNNNTSNADGSSGGVGGGIIMLRLADTSGFAATFYANGTTGLAPDNDGGGGGGAGGTILITSPSAYTGITANVNGAAGTTAAGLAGDTYPGNQHGPGGGGGGGVVITTSTVTTSATGGANGTTTPNLTAYGATSGKSGTTLNGTVSSSSVPGLGSGAECYSSTSSGKITLYNGPYDNGEATYIGGDETGTYDGSQPVTNNNDFTARAIGFPSPAPTEINSSVSGSATSPVGNTFSVASAPSNSIEHALYYIDLVNNDYHPIVVKAIAPILPAQWNVRVCPDNGSNAPNCAYASGTGACAAVGDQNRWESNVGAAGSTSSLTYCYYSGGVSPGVAQNVKYWTVYTGPTGTFTAFSRYDGWVNATDDTPVSNRTHDELYAGFIPIGKSSSVVSKGCPSGVNPASGVCPSGVVQFTLNYANIVAGGGSGTEGQVAALFPISGAGTFVITDDGAGGLAGTNWATYTNGLKEALGSGLSTVTQANCGTSANSCGDTTAGTTCTYDAGHPSGVSATKFVCKIGGAAFQLYPAGFSGQVSSGSLVFAAKVH